MIALTEADTCRKFIVPSLVAAGWDDAPHSFTEQRSFTDGRIIVMGSLVKRGKQKRADYLLRYTRDFLIAVVEAKASYKSAGDGLQQAKKYAEILGLKFAYSTNGIEIIEYDFNTGKETKLNTFPSPRDLWHRLSASQNLTEEQTNHLLTPYYIQAGRIPRYYQEIAINRAVQSILQGKKRILITMATGTGKTLVAFQICWKLWSSRWNPNSEYRRPKILYLADRNILVDDPKDKTFTPFGEARHKIEYGQVIKSREMYFSLYQSIAKDERRPGLYREYAPNFFDLIIVDECHRGSARDESNWREILEYFEPAYQIGMTATPLREDNRNTYRYFGNPIYIYSLRDGINDGFLAPYRVHRVVTTADALGWRPSKGEFDRYGREIPDEEYQTKDFEKIIALRARTEAIAFHLTEYLKQTDRFSKTIVFCVDQEHADEMRRMLNNLNTDLSQQDPNYVCRVTSDEGSIGRGHLSRFQELESNSPVILTTSKLLTTGVDVPMVKNIVLVRVIGAITEFKQIIGRGTRVRDDYGKYFFNILDYTGSATQHFSDPDFDGDPVFETKETINDTGNVTEKEIVISEDKTVDDLEDIYVDTLPPDIIELPSDEPRKYYVNGGYIEIVAHLVYELDSNGKQLRVIKYKDYTAETLRTLYPTAAELRKCWSNLENRNEIIQRLNNKGIDFNELLKHTNQPEADPFDLLCHVAYNAPLRTRRERADRLRKDKKDFFEKFSPDARSILEDLLSKYAEYGVAQFEIPEVLKVPPISKRGNISEIIDFFGGPDKLKEAFKELQEQLYAA